MNNVGWLEEWRKKALFQNKRWFIYKLNVIGEEDYKILEPMIKENKVCVYCWRAFKKPIKTTYKDSICCQKCINAYTRGFH